MCIFNDKRQFLIIVIFVIGFLSLTYGRLAMALSVDGAPFIDSKSVITGVTIEDTPYHRARGHIEVIGKGLIVDYKISVQATRGFASIDSFGNWDYLVNNTDSTVDALDSGQIVMDKFMVTIIDDENISVNQGVTITIQGRTDIDGTSRDDNLGQELGQDTYIIQGGKGNDVIYASHGGSVIAGGLGDDIIYLGEGADIVVYRFNSAVEGFYDAVDGNDSVHDFDIGKDSIVLIDTAIEYPHDELTFLNNMGGKKGYYWYTVSSIFRPTVTGSHITFENAGVWHGVNLTFKGKINGFSLEKYIGGRKNSTIMRPYLMRRPDRMVTLNNLTLKALEGGLGGFLGIGEKAFEVYVSEKEANFNVH